MRSRLLLPLAMAVCLLAATAGCAGEAASTRDTPLTVLAAASLARALESHGETHSFAGSQQLVAQVEAGAPADVVVTADEATMGRLVEQRLVEEPVVVATNSLTIAVQPANPKGLRGLADLGRRDLVVVLADPSVPAGRYAADVLARAGVVVKPRSLELDVESAYQKVALREADAAVVYATDIDAQASAVAIAPEQNVVVRYVAAVVKATKQPARARRYVRRLPASLARFGFGRP